MKRTSEEETPIPKKVRMVLEKPPRITMKIVDRVREFSCGPVKVLVEPNLFSYVDLDLFKDQINEYDKSASEHIRYRLAAFKPLETLLNMVKKEIKISNVLKDFTAEFDKIETCEWWRFVFHRSIAKLENKQLPEDMLNFAKDTILMPYIDDPDDLGQVVVMIAWYCYGFPGATAARAIIKVCRGKLLLLLQQIIYIIDFVNQSIGKDELFFHDNSRISSLCGDVLCELFQKRRIYDIFDDSVDNIYR